MSISNINQLLLRNIEQLDSSNPLFVNIPPDNFFNDYAATYKSANPTYFTNDFSNFQIASEQFSQSVSSQFNCQYTTNLIHDLVILAFPKSKQELTFLLAMIGPFLAENAEIFFVGENKGGIKSVTKLAKDFVTHCDKLDSARHCILFNSLYNNSKQPFVLDDWFNIYTINENSQTLSIAALPGVFSQSGLDKGTAILLQNMPDNIQGKCLDFGCGSGVISAYIGKVFPDTTLTLIDINANALKSAEKTLSLNNLKGDVFPSNGLSHVTSKFQTIITNPPFHQGIKTNYQATESFFQACALNMSFNSYIIIVANNFLNYQPILDKYVGRTTQLHNQNGFTIYQAQNNVKLSK